MTITADRRTRVGQPLTHNRGAPDDEATLHIRCGSDIHQALTMATFTGRFLEFSDPYCQGPVRRLPRPDFLQERAAFIASAYQVDQGEVLDKLAAEYRDLDHVDAFERLVLWFEHDSYDQLILVAVLDALAARAGQQVMELVCVDQVPGVERFIGLGQLDPEQLTTLWKQQRRALTDADFDQARAAWAALRDPDPGALATLARALADDNPILSRALQRHLAELPGVDDGLSLGQRLVLEIVDEQGPMPAGRIYRELMMVREPLPYLGDLMFWHVLADLAQRAPAVIEIQANPDWPQRQVTLTAAGRALLRGEGDYLDGELPRRYVGAVAVDAGSSTPRWCRRTASLAVRATPG